MCGGVRMWVCQEHTFIKIVGEAGVVAGAAAAAASAAAGLGFGHWGFDG